MKDSIKKLHDILTINKKSILMNAGKISRVLAERKVDKEYIQYKKLQKLQNNINKKKRGKE